MTGKLRNILLFALCSVLLAACSNHDEMEVRDTTKLKVYLYLPEAPVLTKATEGSINSDLLPKENRLKTVDVWVYDRTANTLLGYRQDRDVVLTNGAREIAIDLGDLSTAQLTTLRTHRADVYVIVNQGSLGLNYDQNTPKATIAGTVMSGNTYFGVKDKEGGGGLKEPSTMATLDESSALDEGLPMSGKVENVSMTGSGKVVEIENVKVYRAVSKLRFVFCRTANMTAATINSIQITGGRKSNVDGGHIATTENLFTSTGDATASIGTGYETGTIDFGSLTTEEIKVIADPLSLEWRSGTNQLQTFETRINNAISSGSATELGRCYLRETDRQLHGVITYTLDGTTVKTLNFTMDAENDFVRNHSWTVLGYFYNGELRLHFEVDDWSTWVEDIDYKDEVTVSETINWEDDTTGEQTRVNDSEGYYEKTIVTLLPDVVAVAHFRFNTPINGTWYAVLEPLEGDFNAIQLIDHGGNNTMMVSGEVGPRATLRVRVTNPNPSQRARARLIFSVRSYVDPNVPISNQSFSSFRVDRSEIGAAIEFLQPIN